MCWQTGTRRFAAPADMVSQVFGGGELGGVPSVTVGPRFCAVADAWRGHRSHDALPACAVRQDGERRQSVPRITTVHDRMRRGQPSRSARTLWPTAMVASDRLEGRMPVCAICEHLALPPQRATGSVGVLTAFASLDRAAIDHLGWDGDEQHVVVHACPEHVVDVYRGRIDGMRMAWRLPIEPAAGRRQSPATASASRA